MGIHAINGIKPIIEDTAWVADDCVITGDVTIGENSSVWFKSVIRGDVNRIRIGKNSNIQDGCIIHGSTGGIDTIIGDNVTIGHGAIIHGCELQDNCLIGMGAIILDEAVIPSFCIIAAGAVVSPRSKFEPGFLYAGVPAKKIKALDKKQVEEQIIWTAKKYVEASAQYKKELA